MPVADKTRQKHIAFYIGSLKKGGAERVMVNLADFFYEQGYKVTLVTTYISDNEYEVKHASWKVVPAGYEGATLVLDTEENPAWVDLDGGEKNGIRRVFSALLPSEKKDRLHNLKARSKKLRDIWKELKPDVVLSFIGKNNIMALSTATREEIKVVVSVRADPDMEYNTVALKSGMLATFPKASGIVVQTTDALKWFPRIIQKKCTILPNSMNPSFIRPRYIGEREKRIVMVGRLDENKNQSLVMSAFARVTKDKFKDYTLILYGDGPDRIKLQHLAVKLGIEQKVEFRGVVRNVPEHIEKATLFILASSQEGMPNSLIEAMSLGLPCISTDCPCGGPKDLIRSGENGLLVPIKDEDAMVEAMTKLLSDPELCDRIGKEAVKVQEKYRPEITNKAWKEYLDGIMDKR